MDTYVLRPNTKAKSSATRDRLFAIPEGQALVCADVNDPRKLLNSLSAEDKKIWKFRQRTQSDGTVLVWMEKRVEGDK